MFTLSFEVKVKEHTWCWMALGFEVWCYNGCRLTVDKLPLSVLPWT